MRYEQREYVVRDMIQDTGNQAMEDQEPDTFHPILMYILADYSYPLLDVMKGFVLLIAYFYASCSCLIVLCPKRPHDNTDEDGRPHGQKCFAFYVLAVLDWLRFLTFSMHCTSRSIKALHSLIPRCQS